MDQTSAHETGDRITRCFREIETTRMAGIPILNPALAVEVVGLQVFNGEWLCILITPWFMNIMLLPMPGSDGAAVRAPATGTKQTVVFPAGRFEMICGFEERLGTYRMCSLFSPVLEFADHASALAAAQAALAELLASADESELADDDGMAAIWCGERPRRNHGSEATSARLEQPEATTESAAVAERQPLSRRSLLFGSSEREKAQ